MVESNVISSCLERKIRLVYLTNQYNYKGEIGTTALSKNQLVRQIEFTEKNRLEMSRLIVDAKTNNQLVFLRRKLNNPKLKDISYMRKKITQVSKVDEILGIEGYVSKIYFDLLNNLLPNEFRSIKRSRRPAKDEINSLLNFGYTILYNEIISILLSFNLNPFIGFYHKDKLGHASLASDLMEEYRTHIIDSLIVKLLNKETIKKDMFYRNEDKFYLNKEGRQIFIIEYNKKMEEKNKYLTDRARTNREIIAYQTNKLYRAIEYGDLSVYRPIKIR